MGKRKNSVGLLRDEQIRSSGPDCSLCIYRADCERRSEGSFCTKFQGKEPEPKGTDPNELWKRGEEVEF